MTSWPVWWRDDKAKPSGNVRNGHPNPDDGASTCRCDYRGNIITDMDTPGVEVVKAALEPLCGEMHEIFSESIIRANKIPRRERAGGWRV